MGENLKSQARNLQQIPNTKFKCSKPRLAAFGDLEVLRFGFDA
jgi:hypothetical protein